MAVNSGDPHARARRLIEHARSALDAVRAFSERHKKLLPERAFEHLRRLLIVDPTTRALWQAAYKNSEPACERLGATHLLHHGVWTFKADAVGARTDLMYAEPVDLDQAASRCGAGAD